MTDNLFVRFFDSSEKIVNSLSTVFLEWNFPVDLSILDTVLEIYFSKYKYKLFKKVCHLSLHLTEVGCCLLTENTEVIQRKVMNLLNDTPISSSDKDELDVSF